MRRPDKPPFGSLFHASEFLAVIAFVAALLAAGGVSLYVAARWCLDLAGGEPTPWDSAAARAASVGTLAFLFLAGAWARLIEPRLLRTTRLSVRSDKLDGNPGLETRLVFVSDLHVEGRWHLAEGLPRRVAEIAPDAVLLGGDYLNDGRRRSRETLARLIRSLAELAPVLAVLGNADLRRPVAREVLVSAGARVLANEEARLGGGLSVWGLDWLSRPGVELARSRIDRGRFNVCLTHSSGIIPDAAAAGFDLCLCGHTHGGQVRLPFFGALLTLSVLGKRYELGRYEAGGMTAYVTSGAGLEGGFASRVRLLCRPEVVAVELAARGRDVA
jgi:hypothetical protein